MKAISRTLIILVAAAIIVAISYAIVQFSGANNQANAFGSRGGGESGPRGGGEVGAFHEERLGFPEGKGERDGPEGGVLGIAGVGKNLGIIAGIVVIYGLVRKFSAFIRAKKNINPTKLPVSQI